jgi:hypothetical protein
MIVAVLESRPAIRMDRMSSARAGSVRVGGMFVGKKKENILTAKIFAG